MTQIHRTLPQTIYDTLLHIKLDVLNDVPPDADIAISSESLDIRLKKHTARIKTEAIDTATGKVDYARLKTRAVYQDYRHLTALLPHFDLHTLADREHKLAFWLNLYNALVIDGIIHYSITTSVKELAGFFRRVAYNVGGYRFCLDDIEHGILRANAGHIAILGAQFGQDDPRRCFILQQVDFRIHFALVCGARACPPVNFYDAAHIDAQLDLATRNFLAQTVEHDPEKQIIKLSKLLQWYGEDFGAGGLLKLGLGSRHSLLKTLQPYFSDETQAILASPTIKVRFKSYDWALNTV